jgi:S-DNA-T family DNA segregation ATPase FtsK/SpoIIIE
VRAPQGARGRARARRGPATLPRLPHLDQHQLDLLGLALVALGVFLIFPLWAGWEGGAVGEALTGGLAWLLGLLRYAAPVGLIAAGAVVVLRPVLPAISPFKAGGICLFVALALAFGAGTFGLGPDGPHGAFWVRETFEARGGAVGEALYYGASTLLADVGAHILAVFLLVAGVLLLTGASVAGVMRATATKAADTTRSLRRSPGRGTTGRARPAPSPRGPRARGRAGARPGGAPGTPPRRPSGCSRPSPSSPRSPRATTS